MSVKSLQFVGTDVNVDLEVHVDVNVEEHYVAQRCLSCKFFSIQLPAGSPAIAHCNVKYNKLNTERRIQNV